MISSNDFVSNPHPLSTRLSPERHRQHTPRATRTRTRGGGAAFGVMNSPPRTQRTSSTARRSPGSGPRGRYKWMMAAYLCGEILADVCMTSFTFHCCAGLATTDGGGHGGRAAGAGGCAAATTTARPRGNPDDRRPRARVRIVRAYRLAPKSCSGHLPDVVNKNEQ